MGEQYLINSWGSWTPQFVVPTKKMIFFMKKLYAKNSLKCKRNITFFSLNLLAQFTYGQPHRKISFFLLTTSLTYIQHNPKPKCTVASVKLRYALVTADLVCIVCFSWRKFFTEIRLQKFFFFRLTLDSQLFADNLLHIVQWGGNQWGDSQWFWRGGGCWWVPC